MEFPPYTIISSIDEAEQISQDILTLNTIVGFDTETTVNNGKRKGPIDLIQIYIPTRIINGEMIPHHCYLFHIAVWNMETLYEFPQSLAKILKSNNIVKACSAPDGDKVWIWTDFKINAIGFLDIQVFAQLRREPKIGLDSLALNYIPGWKSKNKNIRFLSWRGNLSEEMIEYAVLDAYASYHILKYLNPSLFDIPEIPKIDAKPISEYGLSVIRKYVKEPVTEKEFKRKCASHMWKDILHIAHREEIANKLFRYWKKIGVINETSNGIFFSDKKKPKIS